MATPEPEQPLGPQDVGDGEQVDDQGADSQPADLDQDLVDLQRHEQRRHHDGDVLAPAPLEPQTIGLDQLEDAESQDPERDEQQRGMPCREGLLDQADRAAVLQVDTEFVRQRFQGRQVGVENLLQRVAGSVESPHAVGQGHQQEAAGAAVDRGTRGFLLVALAYGVWRFDGSRNALKQVFNSYLPALEPLADKFGVDLEDSGPVRLIQQAFTARHSTLLLVALGVLAFGILELVEAYGLWFKRRWGEYVAVVVTALFVPLEVHEILVKVSWLRVGALIVNLFAIAYILWTKRLFGFRGGHAAFEDERRNDSLLELEHAAALEYAARGDQGPLTD